MEIKAETIRSVLATPNNLPGKNIGGKTEGVEIRGHEGRKRAKPIFVSFRLRSVAGRRNIYKIFFPRSEAAGVVAPTSLRSPSVPPPFLPARFCGWPRGFRTRCVPRGNSPRTQPLRIAFGRVSI